MMQMQMIMSNLKQEVQRDHLTNSLLYHGHGVSTGGGSLVVQLKLFVVEVSQQK